MLSGNDAVDIEGSLLVVGIGTFEWGSGCNSRNDN